MKIFKIILRVLVTLLFIMFFSACYGVMMPFSATFKINDSEGTGIPHLKISYKDYPEDENWKDAGITDDNGEFILNTMDYGGEDYILKIEDEDEGENLGDFKDKVVNLEDDISNIVMIEKTE